MSAGRPNAHTADPAGEEARLRPPETDGMWSEPLAAPSERRGRPRSSTAAALAFFVVLAAVLAIVLVLVL